MKIASLCQYFDVLYLVIGLKMKVVRCAPTIKTLEVNGINQLFFLLFTCMNIFP